MRQEGILLSVTLAGEFTMRAAVYADNIVCLISKGIIQMKATHVGFCGTFALAAVLALCIAFAPGTAFAP